MNEDRTRKDSDTDLTRPRSGPVRYRLISPEGEPSGIFETAQDAANAALSRWPGIWQRDHDNGGAGWDIEVVGAHQR